MRNKKASGKRYTVNFREEHFVSIVSVFCFVDHIEISFQKKKKINKIKGKEVKF